MTKSEIVKKLESFKDLLVTWMSLDYRSPQISTIRTKINREKAFIQKVVKRAGTSKVYDIGPPPAVGGFVMRNVNPFDVIFDPPYELDLISPIIDSIEEAIGGIESTDNFSFDLDIEKPMETRKKSDSEKVFLVHGHDNELKETVARFLEKIGLIPIILHEQASKGQTIIEKFEEHSNVSYAIVLMTPDDVGNLKSNKGKLNQRARQNVIFELGYFLDNLEEKMFVHY